MHILRYMSLWGLYDEQQKIKTEYNRGGLTGEIPVHGVLERAATFFDVVGKAIMSHAYRSFPDNEHHQRHITDRSRIRWLCPAHRHRPRKVEPSHHRCPHRRRSRQTQRARRQRNQYRHPVGPRKLRASVRLPKVRILNSLLHCIGKHVLIG
jgi:hypothetical protein